MLASLRSPAFCLTCFRESATVTRHADINIVRCRLNRLDGLRNVNLERLISETARESGVSYIWRALKPLSMWMPKFEEVAYQPPGSQCGN